MKYAYTYHARVKKSFHIFHRIIVDSYSQSITHNSHLRSYEILERHILHDALWQNPLTIQSLKTHAHFEEDQPLQYTTPLFYWHQTTAFYACYLQHPQSLHQTIHWHAE